ncbi:MAG: ChaN family lipoprotein [Planctomycetota bacterium]
MAPRPLVPALLLLSVLASACRSTEHDGTLPDELASYKRGHYESLPRVVAGFAGDEDLLHRLAGLDVLLLGDLHDDEALHRRQQELLRAVAASGRELTLLVEFIGDEDRADLDRFLAKRIHLGQLRQRVYRRWAGSWMEFEAFDHMFYRSLLSWARERELRVTPLEPIPRPPLEDRDALMARRIRALAEARPGDLVVVLVGHTHLLGAGHLLDHLGGLDLLAILPRANTDLLEDLHRKAGSSSRAWHVPFLVLDDELWLLNPLPLRVPRLDVAPVRG